MSLDELERRTAPRRREVKRGQISFHQLAHDLNFSRVSFDCMIRNLSDNGAGLVLENSGRIPEAFDLFIREDGTSRKCRVVWRANHQLGVVFE